MRASIGYETSSKIGRYLAWMLGVGGRTVLAATALLAGAALAPPAAQAQNVCNGLINLNYTSGPPFAIVGDIYRVEVALGAGSITGGVLNKLTVSKFRFELDCQNFSFVGCTNEGDIIRYVGDGTITTSNCLDAGNNPVTWTSNGVDSPVGPNQVILTPSSPVVIGANTLPANGCIVEFDVRVQTAPGLDGSPNIVQEAVGYTSIGPFDAACDNGLPSSANQNGQIFLCQICVDDQCFDQACDQNTGMCVQTNEPQSTPCEDDGDLCTNDHCDGQGACVFLSNVMCQAPVQPCEGGAVCDPGTGMCVDQPDGADSIPCPDNDGNVCTIAGCDGLGACDQLHITPDSTPCPDTGNVCATAGCDGAGNCDQLHVPAQDSTPCPDSDGNVCTTPGCDGLGACDQSHVTPDSTPCPDTGNECAVAGCDGAGNCDQLHVPAQDSAPCPDNDSNVCTTAGCDGLGACDQSHITPDSTPCPDTGNECAAAGCDGAGNCDQLHVPVQDSTPCADTDNNVCTAAGCDGAGTCDQGHAPAQDSTPCPDNDGDLCTTAGCDGAGTCDQGHITDPNPDCGGDHYKCYKSRAPFQQRNVSLADQFGPTTATVVRQDRFCNPVNKNNEGINDPTAHLNCYRLREPRGPNRDVVVNNQFGELRLTTTRTHSLCVPAIKDQAGDLENLNINHFKCYRIRRTHGAPKFTELDVGLADQFEIRNTTVIKPFLLCNPVNKNNEGVPSPSSHVTCYKIRDVAGQDPFVPQQPNVTDQFVVQDLQTSRRTDCGKTRLVCVPSSKRIASPSGAFLDGEPGTLLE